MQEDISVVIPTYNEREVIAGTVRSITQEAVNLKEIIVVDDNSPDGTGELIKELSKNDLRIKLISRQDKKGLPGAIAEGILRAKGKIVLWFDADFVSVPGTITRMCQDFNSYDILLLSRYVPGGQDGRREKIRVLASKAFNSLAHFLLRTKTKDLTSGYAMARRDIFDKITFDGIYGEYFTGFIYKAERLGFKVKEMPYICLSRQKGVSKTSQNLFQFARYCLIYLNYAFKLKFNIACS